MVAANEAQHLRGDQGGIRAGDRDRPLRLEQLQRLGRRACFLGILASLTVLAAWARLGPFLLTDHALDQAIADSIGADRLYEAERLLEHASYFHVLTPDRIQEHRQAIEGRNSVGARLWRTARGFVRGDGHSTEELVGSVVSDLTLFGDVRDLGIEGWHALSGQEVDKLRAALSGVGAALTLLPEVKAGASCIKASMKCVSKRLAAEVVELATVAVKERNLTRLEPVLVAVGKAGKVDALAVPAIVKVADSTDEVVTLSRAVAKEGSHAITPMLVFGRLGVRAAKSTYKNWYDLLFFSLAWFAVCPLWVLPVVVPVLACLLHTAALNGPRFVWRASTASSRIFLRVPLAGASTVRRVLRRESV